jgi:hypothetical protein
MEPAVKTTAVLSMLNRKAYQVSGQYLSYVAFPPTEKNNSSAPLSQKRKLFADAWERSFLVNTWKTKPELFEEMPTLIANAALLGISDEIMKDQLRFASKVVAKSKVAAFVMLEQFKSRISMRPVVTSFQYDGNSYPNNITNHYEAATVFAGRKPGANPKNIYIDVIKPIGPVIHACVAIWNLVLELKLMFPSENDETIFFQIMTDEVLFLQLILDTEEFRAVAIKMALIKGTGLKGLTSDDFVKFVIE